MINSTLSITTLPTIPAATTLYAASYRKDYWLKDYIEFGVPDPVSGGRIHIVGSSPLASGVPAAVYLNGTYLNMSTGINPSTWLVDWIRVEPVNGLVMNQPFWISFHSRRTEWDDNLLYNLSSTSLVVYDSNQQILVNGNIYLVPWGIESMNTNTTLRTVDDTTTLDTVPSVSSSSSLPLPTITWVTTTDNLQNINIFIHAGYLPLSTQTLTTISSPSIYNFTAVSILLNGVDILPLINLPALLTIYTGTTNLWSVNASLVFTTFPLNYGSVWTLEITWSLPSIAPPGSSTVTTAGGIFFREFFPMESWVHGSDCPYPTVNTTAYNLHRMTGIDTFFTEYTLDSSCHSSLTAAEIVNVLAPEYGFYVLPSIEQMKAKEINDTEYLSAFFLADEDDTVVDDKARNLLKAVIASKQAWSSQPTYAGGASNKYTGAYAGITDIKGMDAYISACAPHYALFAMPPRGSYDYLANTRLNHAPLPTWLYTQGFEDGWNSNTFKVERQSDAAETAIQVMSVTAAGGKGLMVFETQLSFLNDPVTFSAWRTMSTLFHEIGAMRELYRGGDPTAMIMAYGVDGSTPISGNDIIVESIYHPRAIVITLINVANVGDTYNDVCCLIGPCHFTFVPTLINYLNLTLPIGFTIMDSFEVFNASVINGALNYQSYSNPLYPSTSGIQSIVIPNVQLGIEGPGNGINCSTPSQSIVRTLVLATDTLLRIDIQNALNISGNPTLIPTVQESLEAAYRVGRTLSLTPTVEVRDKQHSSPLFTTASPNITWYQTSQSTGDLFTLKPSLHFTNSSNPCATGSTNCTVLKIDASVTYQTILGFGGALTESAIYVFNQLNSSTQAQLLQDMFGENSEGHSLRYTTGRLTIGSCDFALGYYHYAPVVNDTLMNNFTIEHDTDTIIPFIQQVQSIVNQNNRNIDFIATPWSPPPWMKSNYALVNDSIVAMSCFPLGPLDCALLPEWQPSYALYFSKYISAYNSYNISIYGITPQNEPQPQTGTLTYEGLFFPFTAELQFIGEYLGPQLAKDHPNVKIFIFDHNQAEILEYATPILADPTANSYVYGTAYHWYSISSSGWEPLNQLHDLFPNKAQLATEATTAIGPFYEQWWLNYGSYSDAEQYGTYILNDINGYSIGFITWTFLVNQHGGPDHGDPISNCSIIPCGSNALFIADLTLNPPIVYKQYSYFYMAHISHFVAKNSVRIWNNATRTDGSTSPILSSVFSVPSSVTDYSTVLVLMNPSNYTETVYVQDPRYASVGGTVENTVPPHSIQTWLY